MIKLVRKRKPVRSMTLSKAMLLIGGGAGLHPDAMFITYTENELKYIFPEKLYEYAKPGDYVGLIRSGVSDVVDFQISPHHQNLRDPAWLKRVLRIERVIRLENK